MRVLALCRTSFASGMCCVELWTCSCADSVNYLVENGQQRAAINYLIESGQQLDAIKLARDLDRSCLPAWFYSFADDQKNWRSAKTCEAGCLLLGWPLCLVVLPVPRCCAAWSYSWWYYGIVWAGRGPDIYILWEVACAGLFEFVLFHFDETRSAEATQFERRRKLLTEKYLKPNISSWSHNNVGACY